MATYAIGDIQGCYREFKALLAAIRFDPRTDHLWLAGDLVNRGPDSLRVLEEVRSLGDRATVVLGNHDLHLLALALVPEFKPRRRDTLSSVLSAPNAGELLRWLRQQALIHVDQTRDVALVHAGIPPQWSIDDALVRAREVERHLRDDTKVIPFLGAMYGDGPTRWNDDLAGMERLRYITNSFTRMRYCQANGALELSEKSALAEPQAELQPWFSIPGRRSTDVEIFFGHWSTLRLSARERDRHLVFPLDTGAVWGGSLTAVRLEDRTATSVSSSCCAPFK